MAGAILTAPNTTPGGVSDWTNELGYTEAARYGYDGVSLTEWASGNTTIPEIAAGSTIEIDGSMCEYASDTALTTTGIADGWCYIKHVVSGTVVTPTLVNTFGTWDTAKQGYYDGSGNRYSLFAMYRSGAVTKIYSYKHLMSFAKCDNTTEDGVYTEKDTSGYGGRKIIYSILEGTTDSVQGSVTFYNGSTTFSKNDIVSVEGWAGVANLRFGVHYWLISTTIDVKAYFINGSGDPVTDKPAMLIVGHLE